jgi:hypothetical protein
MSTTDTLDAIPHALGQRSGLKGFGQRGQVEAMVDGVLAYFSLSVAVQPLSHGDRRGQQAPVAAAAATEGSRL